MLKQNEEIKGGITKNCLKPLELRYPNPAFYF
jgi:hypothetical protein